MINILTLKVGDKYGPDYVNNLYNSIKRNTSVEFNFYCYTEDPTGLNENIRIVTLENPDLYYKQWHKMCFHKDNFGGIKTGEKCLILDIDWIITGNIDDILNYELEHPCSVGVFERWWSTNRDQCKLNGGFQMFKMSMTSFVYDRFSSDPVYWQSHYYNNDLCAHPYFGEQNFINENVKEKTWLPMEWFGKYTSEYPEHIQRQWDKEINDGDIFFMDGEFAKSVKMVHFADKDNMIHKYNEEWIKDVWK